METRYSLIRPSFRLQLLLMVYPLIILPVAQAAGTIQFLVPN